MQMLERDLQAADEGPYRNRTSQIRTKIKTEKYFQITKGVRQGGSLSSELIINAHNQEI